jgi:hypothetical protein
MMRALPWLFGIGLAALSPIEAKAQYHVVTSCPSGTPIQTTGGGYGSVAVDIAGNVCSTGGGGGGGGNVTGTGPSVVGNLPSYNNTTATGIGDSGIPASSVVPFQGFNAGQNIFYPLWPGITPFLLAGAPNQNTARCAPFYWPTVSHVDQVAMQVVTLGTGPINVALYTDAIDATSHKHQPQNLIANSSGSFTVTGTGPQTSAMGTGGVGIPLPQGLSWACINDGTASDAVRWGGIALNSTPIPGLIGSATPLNVVSSNGAVGSLLTTTGTVTAGTWPSFVGTTFTEVTSASGAMPILALRVATQP